MYKYWYFWKCMNIRKICIDIRTFFKLCVYYPPPIRQRLAKSKNKNQVSFCTGRYTGICPVKPILPGTTQYSKRHGSPNFALRLSFDTGRYGTRLTTLLWNWGMVLCSGAAHTTAQHHPPIPRNVGWDCFIIFCCSSIRACAMRLSGLGCYWKIVLSDLA